MEPQRRIDPKLAKFLARHAVSEEEAVEADVAAYRGKTPEECWRDVVSTARVAALALALQPRALRLAALDDPPHPSYAEVMRRLRQAGRGR